MHHILFLQKIQLICTKKCVTHKSTLIQILEYSNLESLRTATLLLPTHIKPQILHFLKPILFVIVAFYAFAHITPIHSYTHTGCLKIILGLILNELSSNNLLIYYHRTISYGTITRPALDEFSEENEVGLIQIG